MAITTITNAMVSVNAIQGTLIADNAITAVHIATNAVSGTLIADNAVTATHIAQNTITVTQLADDAVEAAKIADSVITTNHLNKAMISSQTEVTAVGGDFVLIGDTSDSNNLKKALVSDFGETSRLPLAGGTLTGNLTMGGMILKPSGDGGSIGFNRNPDNGNHVGDSAKKRFQINGPDDTGGDFLQIQSYDSSGSHQGNINIVDGNLGIGTAANLERTLTIDTDLAKTSTTTAYPFAIQTNESSANGRFSMHYTGGASAADRKLFLQMEEDGVANAGQIHLNPYGGTVHAPNGLIFGTQTTAEYTLDYYQEGTWTPAMVTTGGVTTTSSNMYGIYTRIGRICFIHAKISVTLSSLPGQTVSISGLPFAAKDSSDSNQRAVIAIGGDTVNTGGNTPKAHFRTNGSQLDGVYYNASNNTAYWAYNGMDSTTFEMNIHGHYTVA